MNTNLETQLNDDVLYEAFCLNTLDHDASLSVNRALIRELGLIEAVLLAELLSQYEDYKKEGTLQPDKSFFAINETLQKKLNITDYRQRQISASLKKQEIIETHFRGVPPKLFYQINFTRIALILGENSQFGDYQ